MATKRQRLSSLAAAATAALATACSSGEALTPPCAKGDTRTCAGPAGCQGGQVCLDDGTGFGPCECGAAGAGGTSATGGSAGSAGSGPGGDGGSGGPTIDGSGGSANTSSVDAGSGGSGGPSDAGNEAACSADALLSDTNNCGECGRRCPSHFVNPTYPPQGSCVNGQCASRLSECTDIWNQTCASVCEKLGYVCAAEGCFDGGNINITMLQTYASQDCDFLQPGGRSYYTQDIDCNTVLSTPLVEQTYGKCCCK